ncbi:MAG TPA: enolase C-terminal domain-like protein [Roseiflexaceae bacterium]|nr:enolase C-terminal domain-like protein [Roseiflexaceae bacterium]HMP39480.1 enolase C-terminal domain-like protein [Roseiflexaceae bacterium]
MAPITIQNVRTILTAPAGIRLIVVKIETSEPGLYGLGCATFTQRHHAVAAAVDHHLRPFLIGKDIQRIEDLWQTMMVNGYWRNGPVLNNAISGVDMALWDLKGKLANMPLYELFGGKCREAAALYRHADGATPAEVGESVLELKELGFHYIRCQMGGYGGRGHTLHTPAGAQPGAYYDPYRYARSVPPMLEHIRSLVGFDIELLHDIHERLPPALAIQLARAVEPYQLFFLEDPLAPEQVEWFRNLRRQTSTPIAMGELWVNQREWVPLVAEGLIDFTRAHISAIGGITPARKMAAFCEFYSVRTAWHGPGDVSPVGHAANLHLDLSSPNFGIQECYQFPDVVCEVFPGCPEIRDGFMYPNTKPGLGIDIDEQLAARFPCAEFLDEWTHARWPDGTAARP